MRALSHLESALFGDLCVCICVYVCVFVCVFVCVCVCVKVCEIPAPALLDDFAVPCDSLARTSRTWLTAFRAFRKA